MSESNHGNPKTCSFRPGPVARAMMGSALLALAAPGAAFAQAPDAASVQSLRELGDTPVDGTIATSDTVANERHYDDYRLHLGRGEVVQVDMESGRFDTYLELWRPGETRAAASNDDREGGSTNSRLIFSAPDEGDYVVRAQDFFDGRGNYRLTLRRLTATAQGQAQPLAPGATDGNIRSDSPVIQDPARPGRGLRYQDFSFQGNAQDRVSLEMSSGDFNTRLELRDPDGTPIVTDDSDGPGFPARIVTELPRAGLYTVRASAPAHRTGSFRLVRYTNQPMPAESDSNAPPIRIGQAVEGTLDEASPVVLRPGERGRVDYFYRLYRLRLTMGQPVTVTMSSPDFDPVLEAGTLFPVLGFAAAVRNDDGGTGNNARMVLQPLRTGWVYLRARSSAAGRGNFTLRVTAGDTRRAASSD